MPSAATAVVVAAADGPSKLIAQSPITSASSKGAVDDDDSAICFESFSNAFVKSPPKNSVNMLACPRMLDVVRLAFDEISLRRSKKSSWDCWLERG